MDLLTFAESYLDQSAGEIEFVWRVRCGSIVYAAVVFIPKLPEVFDILPNSLSLILLSF